VISSLRLPCQQIPHHSTRPTRRPTGRCKLGLILVWSFRSAILQGLRYFHEWNMEPFLTMGVAVDIGGKVHSLNIPNSKTCGVYGGSNCNADSWRDMWFRILKSTTAMEEPRRPMRTLSSTLLTATLILGNCLGAQERPSSAEREPSRILHVSFSALDQWTQCFFTFPDDVRWNAECEAIEFGCRDRGVHGGCPHLEACLSAPVGGAADPGAVLRGLLPAANTLRRHRRA